MISPYRAMVAFGWLTVAALSPLPAQENAEVISIALLDQRPKPVNQPRPAYPRAMNKAGLVGQVIVEMIIGRDGVVEEVTVSSSNNPWFERPALDAVRQWTFTPGLKAGQPVRVRATQQIDFALPGREGTPYFEIKQSANHAQLPPDLQWDEAPKVLATAYPVYPFAALVAGVSGRASVNCVVGPQGRVAQAEVTEATAPEFGQAVLAMLDAWRFTPARKAGEPCGAWMTMTYNFTAASDDVPVADTALAILEELRQVTPRIYGSSALDQPLVPIYRRAPVYPLALRENAAGGEATVEFFIDPKGDVQLPRAVTSTAPAFGYAAVQAVATWRFQPPRKDGQPVMAKARIPIRFPVPAAAVVAPPENKTAESGAVVGVNELGANDVQPVLTEKVRPEFPPAMFKAGISGAVTVEYVIDTKGRVREAKVVSSSNPAFESAALAAVKKFQFSPGKKGGQPVNVRVAQTIEFERH